MQRGAYVLPGIFDTHIHGGGLCDAARGKFDHRHNKFMGTEQYEDVIPTILKVHAKHGTTSIMVGVGALDEERVRAFSKEGRKYINRRIRGGSVLRGLDLEGFYLKDPAYSGAINTKYIHRPEVEYFKRFNELAGGGIKKALVPPEWDEAGLKLIRYMAKNNIVPGVGHSGATFDQFMKAYHAGTKVVVHCGNGPMSQNFKAGGVIDGLFALEGKGISAEVICDYHHVNPKWIVTFIKAFNGNIIGITDAMMVVDAGVKIKEFGDGDKVCQVDKDVLRLKGSPTKALYGSTLASDRAFQNFLNIYMKNLRGYIVGDLFDEKPTLDKAVTEVSRLFSCNPAKLYGLDKEIGSLEKGKNADIVVMAIKKTGKEYGCKANRVFVQGEAI